jgi:hypothetical protein
MAARPAALEATTRSARPGVDCRQYSSYEKGKPMIRMLMIAAMMLLGTACAGGAPEAEEPNHLSEDMEQPGGGEGAMGEEGAMGMDDGEEGDPLVAPGTLPEG